MPPSHFITYTPVNFLGFSQVREAATYKHVSRRFHMKCYTYTAKCRYMHWVNSRTVTWWWFLRVFDFWYCISFTFSAQMLINIYLFMLAYLSHFRHWGHTTGGCSSAAANELSPLPHFWYRLEAFIFDNLIMHKPSYTGGFIWKPPSSDCVFLIFCFFHKRDNFFHDITFLPRFLFYRIFNCFI